MAKILLTIGPIPARLDSVKYITNRFQGGLALKTAAQLQKLGHVVTIVAWEYLKLETKLKVVRVKDVYDYYKKVLAIHADAYILAAAVANLVPLKPWKGKFPSHNYKVGDVFPIEFTIAPRIIDEIKKKYPIAVLIGYKLFDGSQQELIQAAQKTLFESRANLVFANHPSLAKLRKIVVTADGAAFDVTFDNHVKLIDRILRAKFYRTKIATHGKIILNKEAKFIVESYPRHKEAGLTFGTFAIRTGDGFITTTRGKKAGEKALVFIKTVDHKKRIVYSSQKATLNAPLLHELLKKNSQINYLIHNHELMGKKIQNDYQFPGTDGDLKNVMKTKNSTFLLQLPYHGYIAGFSNFLDCQKFIKKHNHVD